MALDNAQFPSELSITDPPGTDPLSEGDDQIRTAKRVVFQGFEFVDKAVLRTADEMNDMALQSQPNAFSASQQFTQPMFLDAASQITDTVLFFRDSVPNGRWDLTMQAVDTNGDFFIRRRDAAGVSVDIPLRIAAADGRATFLNRTIFTSGTRVSDGTAATPSYSFTSSTNFGMYTDGAALSFTTFGVERLRMVTGQMQQGNDGTAGAPAYSFTSNTNVGMYIDAQNDLAFAVGLGSGAFLIKTGPTAGIINMPFLPLSNAGLVSGDLFESSGFVAIVP